MFYKAKPQRNKLDVFRISDRVLPGDTKIQKINDGFLCAETDSVVLWFDVPKSLFTITVCQRIQFCSLATLHYWKRLKENLAIKCLIPHNYAVTARWGRFV